MHSEYDADEFTAFMARYLRKHPEVVADQQRGWDLYWNPHLSQAGRQDIGTSVDQPDLTLYLDDELYARGIPMHPRGAIRPTVPPTLR